METINPDSLQVPRFVAKVAGGLLAALIAVLSVDAIGAPPGGFNVHLLAVAGAPVLLLLLGTSIYLLRKGAGWPLLWQLWLCVLIAAAIVPVHMLIRMHTSSI